MASRHPHSRLRETPDEALQQHLQAALNSASRFANMPGVITRSPAEVPSKRVLQDTTTSRRNEQMDLVEQLYGAKLSVKDVLPDMSETIPLPNAPKNKVNDLLAWDRKDLSR